CARIYYGNYDYAMDYW
nr:immunoglobulin heavy chain junction region [Mus musculus]